MAQPVRRRSSALLVVVAAALAVTAAAFAGNGGLAPPSPASPSTERIADAYWWILGLTLGIFVLVETLLVVFLVRFRSRGRPRDVEGPQIRGHTRLELAWTAGPVLILAAIAAFVFYKLPGIEDPPANASDRINIKVEGRQFYWQFTYPNGAVTIDTMRAPLDRVVTLDITAPAHDVIHSWWIPELHAKFDAIPGEVNQTWFQAKRLGVFEGECGEFCGVQHAVMYATVEIVPPGEYERWVEEQAEAQRANSSDLGRQEWEAVCQKCHRLEGDVLVGPNLGGNTLLAQADTIERIVREGQGTMPAVGKGWTQAQMRALTTYLRENVATEGGGGGGG